MTKTNTTWAPRVGTSARKGFVQLPNGVYVSNTEIRRMILAQRAAKVSK